MGSRDLLDPLRHAPGRARLLVRVFAAVLGAGVMASPAVARATSRSNVLPQNPPAQPSVTASLPAQPTLAAPPLFRVILTDGTAISCLGEWVRTGNRIVLSVPIGDTLNAATVQLVTLPASAVDWESTERYAESVRYRRYLATRAEADFAVFTGQVWERLKEIPLADGPARRLELAERIRRELAAWPRDHYGYRSADIREMSSQLEELVSQIRAESGVDSFDLSLVATIEPPAVPLLPNPTPVQTIAQALTVARISDTPAEREGLLLAIVKAVDEATGGKPEGWYRAVRGDASILLEADRAVDQSYESLSRRAVSDASRLAASGDVRAVQHVIDSVRSADKRLGGRRPERIESLLAALDSRLDSARRLRLSRDQWSSRLALYRTYARQVAPLVDTLVGLRESLEDIRAMAGPSPSVTAEQLGRVASLPDAVRGIPTPTDLQSVQAMLVSASTLAVQALRTRLDAASSADMQLANDAAAAAAGSLLFTARARSELAWMLTPPGVQ